MKALVKCSTGPGDLCITEMPEPQAGPGQVKVRVAHCGVCGTDLRIWDGHYHLKPPIIPGHEVSGIVTGVGQGVTGVVTGMRVTCETIVNQCGRCEYCLQGRYQLCPSHLGMGTRHNGGFAEYVVIPEQNAYPLPDGVSLEEGALVEPLACAVYSVFDSERAPVGGAALVIGPGPVGLMVSRLASLHGAAVGYAA